MMEKRSDQLKQPGKGSHDNDEKIDKFFIGLLYSVIFLLLAFACCILCCFCFRKCTKAMDRRILPVHNNVQESHHAIAVDGPAERHNNLQASPHAVAVDGPAEQKVRPGTPSCCLPRINLAFEGPEHELQGNLLEQSDREQQTTQRNMKSDNKAKINQSPPISFCNHPMKFHNQVIKHNSPTLTTIIESKPSNNSSKNGLELPPEMPETSPPSSQLLGVPTNLSALHTHYIPPTLNSTRNTSTLPDTVNSVSPLYSPQPLSSNPHYLPSGSRPCCIETQLLFQGRLRNESCGILSGFNLPQNTPLTPNFQSFLNSQIHHAADNDLTPSRVLDNDLLQAQRTSSAPIYSFISQSNSQTNQSSGSIPKPEPAQIFPQDQNNELLENSSSVQDSKTEDDSQSANGPEIFYSASTSNTSVDCVELSAPSNGNTEPSDSSLFTLGTSRLKYYRGCNIPINDINSTDLDSTHCRRYCPLCHLCTDVCECNSSDEKEDPEKPKQK